MVRLNLEDQKHDLKKKLPQVRSLQVSLGEGRLLSSSKGDGAASANLRASGESSNSRFLGSSTRITALQVSRFNSFSIRVLILA